MTRPQGGWWIILALLAGLVVDGPARAEDLTSLTPEERAAKAKHHYTVGSALFRRGDYAEAAENFQRLQPCPAVERDRSFIRTHHLPAEAAEQILERERATVVVLDEAANDIRTLHSTGKRKNSGPVARHVLRAHTP